MSKTRLLPAALLVVLPLVGCAAGQHDATSQEHAPRIINAQVGTVQLRNIVITPATGGSASPSPTDTGSAAASPSPSSSSAASAPTSGGAGAAQAYLSMVVISNTPDELTGVSLSGGGNVAPTDASAQLTVGPNSILSIVDPESGSSGPAIAISGLPTAPQLGTSVELTITFRTAGSVKVQAPVRDLPSS